MLTAFSGSERTEPGSQTRSGDLSPGGGGHRSSEGQRVGRQTGIPPVTMYPQGRHPVSATLSRSPTCTNGTDEAHGCKTDVSLGFQPHIRISPRCPQEPVDRKLCGRNQTQCVSLLVCVITLSQRPL